MCLYAGAKFDGRHADEKSSVGSNIHDVCPPLSISFEPLLGHWKHVSGTVGPPGVFGGFHAQQRWW